MQANVADAVHPIFCRVLELADRLHAGQTPSWDDERHALRKLLGAMEPQESPELDLLDISDMDTPEQERFLSLSSIRYALTAWLDGYLGACPLWGERWRQQPLEAELYGEAHGPGKFWEEVRYAETRGDRNALEVALWCAALGHSATWPGNAASLAHWQKRVQGMLERLTPSWAAPGCLPTSPRELFVPSDLPLRRLAFAFLGGVALVAPLVAAWWLH